MDFTNTMIGALGMEVIDANESVVKMTMPVDERTKQPMGYLHGGASVALAESAASIGTALNVDLDTHNVFGIEINANHLKSKRDGVVTAIALPLHKGRTTMVWEIKLTDEEDELICISRCTTGMIEKKLSKSK
ncbi:hotdog fold thioesterase [Pseudalkalibacillus berkeleyi]|uniref:Hotdog fold thioesterase n=1 Tax=Pseudalkalibacillus berkeleyi TaxID=1069813 RepID=A0ABS9H386_9BACL|nr:hotdog fold thioesterase [Pseudalkalibacillus berkeleyi]MCF6138396.1 hotdog fold thioesterase [Pseudalkalibacillus berkeleyi]